MASKSNYWTIFLVFSTDCKPAFLTPEERDHWKCNNWQTRTHPLECKRAIHEFRSTEGSVSNSSRNRTMNWQSEKRKFRHFLDYFCSRVLINGFLEIYSQKPTILDVRVADVILDTTMKMMILSIWKRPTQRQIWIFFCFSWKIYICSKTPKKMGFSWLTTRRQRMGERVVSCLEYYSKWHPSY